MNPKLDNSGGTMYVLRAAEYEALTAKVAALDVAVAGLRELQSDLAREAKAASEWVDPAGDVVSEVIDDAAGRLSALLDKIGATR